MKLTLPSITQPLLRHLKSALLVTCTASLLTACMSNGTSDQIEPSGSDSYIIHNGKIVTMAYESATQEPYPDAIWIQDGIIKALGDLNTLEQQAGQGVRKLDLAGKTLMPGFIEPHTHLAFVIGLSVMTDLSPCLPEPYKTTYYKDDNDNFQCPTSLQETYDTLNDSKKRISGEPQPKLPVWVWGNGIDPSRLGNSDKNIEEIRQFINNPAIELNKNVNNAGAEQPINSFEPEQQSPIMLLDQSGHVAYVNLRAFVAAGLCHSVTECSKEKNTISVNDFCPEDTGRFCYNAQKTGGFEVYNTPDNNRLNGTFTGRVLESPNFVPFLQAISLSIGAEPGSPFVYLSEDEGMTIAPGFIHRIAQTGVTTLVNAGAFQSSEALFFKKLAKKNQDTPNMRYRTLVATDIADSTGEDRSPFEVANSLYTGTWDNKTDGLYGAYGVKIWADGSTQGCSAYLKDDYAKNGICDGEAGDSGKNYEYDSFVEELKNYWGENWLIQVHANGDAAIEQALTAFKELQTAQCQRESGNNTFPITLHHATVGGNPAANESAVDLVVQARNEAIPCINSHDAELKQHLNITVSHTPAHVAYWGGAFQSILDGKGHEGESDSTGRATMLDPAKFEHSYDVPFSLHSDMPVSPVNPLWYVEQMVNRDTWFYPRLATAQKEPMPYNPVAGQQNIDVYQALRGVTIVPAQQNLLDEKIGTLEVNKVADLVILDRNPLAEDVDQIHTIKPCYTFVNGHSNPVYESLEQTVNESQDQTVCKIDNL
ncbi:amidohydrolase [Pseudoalteromonas rubra]|uniref:amidohydrolase n=1 Tax=Pseudoalteromonas rubra TaxID=43658 RepID=UPI002DB5C298|nr:amidohydrolase family protein [Pseudoalteromonas rubra]MEC4090539.1 amidohydrolase family protein [Pseudoalteromonas rubra]